MKILITGGCGFLGTNLAESILLNNLAELFILDNLARKGSRTNLDWLSAKGTFKFLEQDIRDSNGVEKLVHEIQPDIVFHLAGQVAMTTSIADPKADFETNALGTLNILEAIRKHSPECGIIYSSTNKVYGDLDWVNYEESDKRYIARDYPNGFPENIQLSFQSPYGCSKGAADQYVLDYHRMFNLKTVVFRHSSMYGGRQFSTYDQGWIGWFCEKALETRSGKLNKPFTISGNGKQVRDVLHAEDMINLYFAAAKSIDKIKGEAFNIGGGISNSLSLLELFDILESELACKLNYEQLPWRLSDQKVFIADIRKFSQATNWVPKVDKVVGIRKMINWLNTSN
jgi:CDP-paratose 2-epimerase